MPLSNAEIDAVIKVLWHTHAIRSFYEDCAISDDERMWKNNGGMFTNHARYHSEKWKKMMGPDDPNVRGRRISSTAIREARRSFENSCREPVKLALELAEQIHADVANAVKRHGATEGGTYEEDVVSAARTRDVQISWRSIARRISDGGEP